jgi:hypothetical protein
MTTRNTIATISLALVAFVFGCVTEALVVPPVRANTTATRWEFKCIHDHFDPEEDGVANRLGAQGWELVGANGGNNVPYWCFKRPLP